MIDEQTQPGTPTTPDSSDPHDHLAEVRAVAVERWLADHGDMLWRFVLGRVGSREAAEDVVQETILAAMQSHETFAGGSSERTWLLGIAAHKVADHFRAARRRAGVADVAKLDAGEPESIEMASMFTAQGMWAKPPGEWALGKTSTTENVEMLAALRRCIEALPPSQAQAVFLRDILNVPSNEVCKAMSISPTNLWSRMHRARAALRACVEKSLGMSEEGSR